MKKIYWTMKNGDKIDVDEMSEQHLRNVLKLILRRKTMSESECDATEVDIY